MKSIFAIFIFTLCIQNIYACLSASQNRLFPLGISSKGFLVVETCLHRSEYGKPEEANAAWSGQSYFNIYDENYKEIHSELIETIKRFEERHYEKMISKTFDKGLKLAKYYTGFVQLKPVSISFCDYQQSCNTAKLIFDTLTNNISVNIFEHSEYQVKPIFDTTSIASNVIEYYRNFNEANLSATWSQSNLYISSVRQFHVGDKKLTVVHLGIGQKYTNADGTYPPDKEYKPEFEFTELKKSTFEEPVLHHGNGFDFYIWH